MPRVKTCRLCHRPAGLNGYCRVHADLARERTDTAEWRSRRARKLRAWLLAEYPFCADCLAHGKHTPAVQVHHLVTQILAPDRVRDASNLVTLCADCHRHRHDARFRPGWGGEKS